MIVVVGEFNCAAQGEGRRRAISRSNKRNRIAIRKNRMENGNRAEPSGSNPHSYGESFSESGVIIGSQKLTVRRIRERAVAMAKIVAVITFSQILTEAL